MDGPRFDAWTRRRFGLLAGGVAAALLRLSAADAADARQRKKKPRCRPLRFECNDKNRHKRCCPGLFCAEVEGLGDTDRCCQAYRSPCRDDSECCGFAECKVITGLDNVDRCCGDEGGPCGAKLDCCGDLACDTVKGSSTSQCCLEVQERCEVFDPETASICCRNLNCDAVDGLPGGLRCCSLPGGSCNGDNDCCEDLFCNTNNLCEVPPP